MLHGGVVRDASSPAQIRCPGYPKHPQFLPSRLGTGFRVILAFVPLLKLVLFYAVSSLEVKPTRPFRGLDAPRSRRVESSG